MDREVRSSRNPYLWITPISLSLVVASLGFLVIACGGSSTAPSAVSSVTVTGTPPAVGASSQYSATATMSNGTTEVVTTSATWTSSNPDIATVTPGGLVTAIAEGTVTIQATFDNISGTTQAAVAAPAASLP
jgi:uncharacterized protein YjdB